MRQKVTEWARGKNWWMRGLVLAWFAFTYVQYVSIQNYALNRTSNIINAVDFGVHELGHILFSPFGMLMTYMGGSLWQVIFPLLWFAALLKKGWYFASSLCLCWCGFSLLDVADYVADARARAFPLASLSSDYDSAHDWYNILSQLNALESDLTIAAVLRFVAHIIILAGFVMALWLLVTIIYHPRNNEQL